LLDGVLSEGRRVHDFEQATLDQADERDEGVGSDFGNQLLLPLTLFVAKGKSGLLPDRGQQGKELLAARGRSDSTHSLRTDDHLGNLLLMGVVAQAGDRENTVARGTRRGENENSPVTERPMPVDYRAAG
jgi:hypothetical protein